MRRHLLFCALGALWGCRTVSEPSGTAIALFCSTSEQSKTDILTVGEEVAVFACPEGTEDYFLEAAQFIVGSDGQSLNYGSTVYYPDPKQAVRFWAYFPYHKGTFSVPTDQSTAKALKEADLCGATASTTPVATPVALAFKHLMARLVITTNEPTTKMVFPNAVASGVVHAATAELVLGAERKDIWTDKNEFIVPVQPLSRLVLTVADTVLDVVSKVEYVFDTAPIALQVGQTTTLDLTLHPATKTATLSGSSVTDWELVKTEGNLTQAVSNTFTVHWPKCHPQSNAVDRIVLTIKDEVSGVTANYAVEREISYANQTFTVPFAFSALHYPYTIVSMAFYQANTFLHESMSLLGGTIIKSGACVVGIRQPLNTPTEDDYVTINGLKWAKGNLVAVSKTNNHECKIGAPADGGLYFQFGSLIGYKGGALANGGTGVGSNPHTGLGTQSWGGATKWSWANDAMVWPAGMVGVPLAWPQGAVANAGVGDPCSYYLGGTWRLPTTVDYKTLCNNEGGYGVNIGWTAAGGSWVTSPVVGGYLAGNKLFFPSAGCRYPANGLFNHVAGASFVWSSSVSSPADGLMLYLGGAWAFSQYGNSRYLGVSVRCVSN